MTESFSMDDFCHQHLTAWFDNGLAPNDWDRERLEQFRTWIVQNPDLFPYDAGWRTITTYWEDSVL